MTYYFPHNTCRFCKKASHEDARAFIKYGPRHYACQPCYIEHKDLDDLSDRQLGRMSFLLLKEKGKLDYVERRMRG